MTQASENLLKFELWYRKVNDGRVPEYIHLERDYQFSGLVVGKHKREVESHLARTPELSAKLAGETRAIKVGDILVELGTVKQTWIYTPTGSWALVKLIED